ncbi:preferentially expressed antigen in melanoma like 6, partial [Sigmodon hispidus]
MSNQNPLTLMQLARQRLLREEALIISTLEELPMELLPGIFEEALTDRRTNILKAMVPAWPFPCLRVGSLTKNLSLETLKALLEGLESLIKEKVHPRSKLRVLDLTHMLHDFLSIINRAHEDDCSPQAIRQKQPLEICPKPGMNKPFMVVTDLEFRKAGFNKCDTYLLDWAQQQKDSIHLRCRKLQIVDSPVFTAIEIFKIVHLNSILQLHISQWWLEFMVQLFPYLAQMRNLHTLVLEGNQDRFTASPEQQWLSKLPSLFSKLSCLQNLHVNNMDFLTGCLAEWLRYMKTSLQTLSITDCQLSHSDIDSLSQYLNICELRYLNLSGTVLSDLCPKLLGVLFEKITRTLKTLELEECEMGDSHFNAILPALSQCSQLTEVNFYDNNISLCVLKNLIYNTFKLSNLKYELYPAPLECYNETRIRRDKFQQLCPELLDKLRAQRQPKTAKTQIKNLKTGIKDLLGKAQGAKANWEPTFSHLEPLSGFNSPWKAGQHICNTVEFPQTSAMLQQLAIERLLKEEALAISVLKDIPRILLPPMLEAAFKNRRTNVLEAMVATWPFSYLSVGAMITCPHLETLKALLGGLDEVLKQRPCPRYRWNEVEIKGNRMGEKEKESSQSAGFGDCHQQKTPVETCLYSGVKKYLKVITDLKIQSGKLNEWAMYLLQWAQQRRESIHLCCSKLQILVSSVSDVIEILESVDLHCIRELHLCYLWIEDLTAFGPYLGQMRNLHTLVLEGILHTFRGDDSEGLEEKWISTLISQFPKLHCLQHLYVDDTYHLAGCLTKSLRYLKKPLETLSISYCDLPPSDWESLPQCPNLSELIHLNLSSVVFGECIEPLGLLLEKVSTTLQILELEKCWLEDSQFIALMAPLSQCSQLTKVNFYDNSLSLQVLKQLLHHTAKLRKLTEELYPAPLECYDSRNLILVDIFDQLCPELLDILRSKRQPKTVAIATSPCSKCFQKFDQRIWRRRISFDSYVPMEVFHRPQLQQLAIERLLKEEALAISVLNDIPRILLPPMLEAAFKNRCTNVLEAMVATWPFPFLSVGAMIKCPHLETLKALLGGLDEVLKQRPCPRKRNQVKVLDLITVDCDSWSTKAEYYKGDCHHQIMRQKNPVETCIYSGVKKDLKVITDLKIVRSRLDEWAIYLLQWAQQRRESIHLCCSKLQILISSVSDVIEILESVDLHCIRELHLCYLWIEDLTAFGPYLGQMRNLHTLVLEGILHTFRGDDSEGLEEKWISTLISQFPKLHCLQHLYVDDTYHLAGCLTKSLRYLKKPLETLSISYCDLPPSDWESLPQCPNLSELIHLNLSSVVFGECIEPLGLLLEKVSTTLQILELEKCWLEDSQFIALMAPLSQCSRLTKVNFYDNSLSLQVLKQLLHHTAKLRKLTEELYPAPLECYDSRNLILVDIFDQLCPQLLNILRSKRQPKTVAIATSPCSKCRGLRGIECFYYKTKQVCQDEISPRICATACVYGSSDGIKGVNSRGSLKREGKWMYKT